MNTLFTKLLIFTGIDKPLGLSTIIDNLAILDLCLYNYLFEFSLLSCQASYICV